MILSSHDEKERMNSIRARATHNVNPNANYPFYVTFYDNRFYVIIATQL